MIDAKAFGAELADIVKTATAPLLRRIDQLEKQLADMPAVRDGKDGKDGDNYADGLEDIAHRAASPSAATPWRRCNWSSGR